MFGRPESLEARQAQHLAFSLSQVRSKLAVLLFGLCTLDVDFAPVDGSCLYFVDEVLRHFLVFEQNEPKATGLACVNVFQNYNAFDLAELQKVLTKLFCRQSEVQSAHKDLGLGVLVNWLRCSWFGGVSVDDDVRVGFVAAHSVHSRVAAQTRLIHVLKCL